MAIKLAFASDVMMRAAYAELRETVGALGDRDLKYHQGHFHHHVKAVRVSMIGQIIPEALTAASVSSTLGPGEHNVHLHLVLWADKADCSTAIACRLVDFRKLLLPTHRTQPRVVIHYNGGEEELPEYLPAVVEELERLREQRLMFFS